MSDLQKKLIAALCEETAKTHSGDYSITIGIVAHKTKIHRLEVEAIWSEIQELKQCV